MPGRRGRASEGQDRADKQRDRGTWTLGQQWGHKERPTRYPEKAGPRHPESRHGELEGRGCPVSGAPSICPEQGAEGGAPGLIYLQVWGSRSPAGMHAGVDP